MMRGFGRWLLLSAPGAIAGALAISASGLAPGTMATASAAPTAGSAKHATVQNGSVSPNPASGTPELVHHSGVTDQIRQIVQCGQTMYAVGQFTEIKGFDPSTGTTHTLTRNDIFSFSAIAPYGVTSWTPSVGGPNNLVDTIALNSTCSHAYIGGHFNNVDGVSGANDIAYIRTYNNTMVTSTPHSASAEVDTLLMTPNDTHLLAGGEFTSINGSKNKYYVSLNPSTGKDDSYLTLGISGNYVYPKVKINNTQVYNQQLSPDGGHVLAEGVFTRVEGNARQQIFMLNLSTGKRANVSTWDSTEFNGHCATKHPFYVKAAAWSPDESIVYVADTGLAVDGWQQGNFPLTGLCDAVAAFPGSRAGGLSHIWVNYTGCDSLYSVAADASTVYVGGHERWADNAGACNAAGPNSVPAQGMGGFTPSGSLLQNSAGTAGLYSRGRGLGADDMLVTSAGLWIASDDEGDTDTCGNASNVAGICFLQY